jgi:DNA-binding transcriptional MerR regulator
VTSDSEKSGGVEKEKSDDSGSKERSSTSQRLQAASKLEKWVEDRNPPNAELLRRLASDIRRNERLNEWGQFALEDLLRPPRRDPSEYRLYRLAEWITLLRNVALFLPVLLTWHAISHATKAYSDRAIADQEETFLDYWLNADLLGPWAGIDLTLQRVAMIDAIIILALVILTVIAQGVESRAERNAARADKSDEEEFHEVLVDVGLFLHGFRAITPGALKSGLADAVNNLGKANSELVETSQRLAEVLALASGTLERWADVGSRQVEPAVARIDQIVSAVATTVDANEKRTNVTMAHLDQMQQIIAKLRTELEASTRVLGQKLEGIDSEIAQRLEAQISTFERALRGVIDSTDRIGESLKTTAITVSEVANGVRHRVDVE